MTNHHTDSTVIHRVITFLEEERRLQNTGRETNFVGGRIVIGIHRLRSHQPFITIDGLAHLGFFFFKIESSHGFQVVVQRLSCINLQSAIIFPLVGITNFHAEGSQFFVSLLLGFVAHPSKLIDTFTQAYLQVGHQFHHSFLGSSGEITIHISNTKCLTHSIIERRNGTLPTGRLFLTTRQSLTIEIEAQVGEIITQRRGGIADNIPGQVIFNCSH